MNKALLCFGFLLGLMLAGLSCGKDQNPTIIKGRITDRKTGAPIEGVFVYMGGKKWGMEEYFTQSCGHTDVDGQFNCTIQGEYVGSDISKDGYVLKHNLLGIKDGQENEVMVQLVPRDGFLKLKIENNTGIQSPLYVTVYSRTIKTETKQNSYYTGESIKEYPLSISQGDTYAEILNLPSPELVQIRWGFGQSTLIDSIMVITGDTASYILSY